jgi:hypothetical protein
MFKYLKLHWLMAKPISLYLNGEQWLVLQGILQIAIYKYEAKIAAWAYPNDRTMRRRLGQDVVALLRKIRKSRALTDPVQQDSAHMVTSLSFSHRVFDQYKPRDAVFPKLRITVGDRRDS